MLTMADVSEKAVTVRKARASGRLSMGRDAFLKLRDGALKKGDPLPMAEIAAVTGAKRTAEWIPLCHPLPLDHVGVTLSLDEAKLSITVEVEVTTSAKTGVEMEALTGVSNALLALYDVIKADDPALTIGEVMLLEKTGGKSGHYMRKDAVPAKTEIAVSSGLKGVRAAAITVSDRVSRGQADDTSGPAVMAWLEGQGALVSRAVVSDERAHIIAAILQANAELVVLTGGTGLGPRDVTPEAVSEACDRMIPGFGEAFRSKTASHTQKAWLSRCVAGLRGSTLIVALPGSERAVKEGLDAIGALFGHALHVARGGGH